jgi:hypothetical protein
MTDKNKPPKKKTTFKQKLLLILFGLLFGTILSEVGLRIVGYSYPQFYQNDQYRGFALRPGVEGTYRREGTSYVRVNSDGLRDREHPKVKPANTVRIALLGDSFTEAMHLPMEQTYWWRLQEELKSCPEFAGKDVEIINFGVSGYGTGQELMTLREKVWAYTPDVVMLLICTSNDTRDNYRPLSQTEQVPYFIYRNGELVLDDSFRTSRAYLRRDSGLNRLGAWFHDNLRIIQLIHYAQFVGKLRFTEWRDRRNIKQEHAAPGQATAQDIGIDNMPYVEPHDDNWKNGWDITEKLLVQMRNEVTQHGAKFLMVTGSNGIQVYPDPVIRQNFMRHIGVTGVFYPNQRFKALADREKIDFFDLAEPMQKYADEHKVFLHGFDLDIGNGHWNSAGHQVVSNLLKQKICSDKEITGIR